MNAGEIGIATHLSLQLLDALMLCLILVVLTSAP